MCYDFTLGKAGGVHLLSGLPFQTVFVRSFSNLLTMFVAIISLDEFNIQPNLPPGIL